MSVADGERGDARRAWCAPEGSVPDRRVGWNVFHEDDPRAQAHDLAQAVGGHQMSRESTICSDTHTDHVRLRFQAVGGAKIREQASGVQCVNPATWQTLCPGIGYQASEEDHLLMGGGAVPSLRGGEVCHQSGKL